MLPVSLDCGNNINNTHPLLKVIAKITANWHYIPNVSSSKRCPLLLSQAALVGACKR
jgi:hypothetical protein